MRKAMKWDFDKHEYEEVEISDDCCIFTENMQQIVECPNCGKKHKYGGIPGGSMGASIMKKLTERLSLCSIMA